jgi:hypothetical protein
VRDNIEPERLPDRLHQPGDRSCDLIFGSTEPRRERLPDGSAKFGDSIG